MCELKNKDYVITVSYGNYITGVGGTDKVILEHQILFNENKISLLHIFPVFTMGHNIHIPRKDVWGVVADGNLKGYYTTKQLKNLIYKFEKNNLTLRAVYVHHLNDINIKELSTFLAYVQMPIYFYIHDYMTICPTGGLIRNHINYCGVKKPCRAKCDGCKNYSDKVQQRQQEIEEFFESFKDELVIIAPSEVAREIWCTVYPDYLEKTRVIPHQRLNGIYENNMEPIADGEMLRVGFVGYQKELKGAEQWKEAAKAVYENAQNIELFQFGRTTQSFDYVKEIETDFANNLSAMTIALRENKIHCAVLWSLVPETYSYTYYETWASNAFILTNKYSGNICKQTVVNQNGYVASEINELKELLLNEKKLRTMINKYRSKKEYGPLLLEKNDELLSTILPVVNKKEYFKVKIRLFDCISVLVSNVMLKSYFKLQDFKRNEVLK